MWTLKYAPYRIPEQKIKIGLAGQGKVHKLRVEHSFACSQANQSKEWFNDHENKAKENPLIDGVISGSGVT